MQVFHKILLHLLKVSNLFVYLAKIKNMQEKKKQERAIVHLQIGERHYYYGNLKAMTDEWTKEKIGVTYSYLKNLNISEERPYLNEYCIIRRGIIVTSHKKK